MQHVRYAYTLEFLPHFPADEHYHMWRRGYSTWQYPAPNLPASKSRSTMPSVPEKAMVVFNTGIEKHRVPRVVLSSLTLADTWHKATKAAAGVPPHPAPLPDFHLTPGDSLLDADVKISELPSLPKSVTMSSAGGEVVTLFARLARPRLLSTAVVGEVPVQAPAPARLRRADLSPMTGHVIALEYLEERPTFLNAKGMGLRLTTYYR